MLVSSEWLMDTDQYTESEVHSKHIWNKVLAIYYSKVVST